MHCRCRFSGKHEGLASLTQLSTAPAPDLEALRDRGRGPHACAPSGPSIGRVVGVVRAGVPVEVLGLPVRGLGLQVLWSGGLVMDPVVRSTDHRSLITVTAPARIMFDRRVRLLDLTAEMVMSAPRAAIWACLAPAVANGSVSPSGTEGRQVHASARG